MITVRITAHTELASDNGEEYRKHRFSGDYASPTLSGKFVIDCEDGQYDFVDGTLSDIADEPDGDEPIQVAIGEYMREHDIPCGKYHR